MFSNLRKGRTITVKARKRLDDLLEGENRYYQLVKPNTWYGREWLYYVLRIEKESANSKPKYRIIRAFSIS